MYSLSVCQEEREARRLELRDASRALRVQQQLQKLKNGVFRFQEQLMDVKPSPDVIEKLRETMSDIENSINAFKDTQHQRYDELLKDERSVWQEICAFERKMDSWCVPVRADGGPPRSEKPCDWRSLPAEVTALQTFLQQTGGRDGGWDEFDHRSFLKVWTKHRGKPSYRHEARLYLPGKTEEEVKRHEDWFLELRRLQEDKREVTSFCIKGILQREQRDADEEPQEDEEQEEQRREASEDQILQTRRAKEERRRQLELKLLVEAHLQQKKEQEELRVLEEEAQEQAERQERQRQAAEGIRRFQERDSRRLEEKLQEKQSKEQEQSERQRTLDKLKDKVEVHISRDPSRLWRLTKVWQERTKEIGPSGAVPAWRQDS
uniref:Coiled-coil domain-containing protein 112-like n=1 Tax=Sinocyclocheilus grahami TaxID=75366 RepID=A0A672M8X2_SINGR